MKHRRLRRAICRVLGHRPSTEEFISMDLHGNLSYSWYCDRCYEPLP